MLFSLTSIKKRSVRDPDGELAVVPTLLRGRAALRLVEQAIALYEESVGTRYGEFDTRALEAIMGDYRLGRCIEACLRAWYDFKQPHLSDCLTPEELEALEARGIASPSALRMALWDAANEQGGFVLPGERPGFLSRLASEWGLGGEGSRIDALVSLDSDSAAVLVREGERPTAGDVVRLYNRGAVKTLLAHSTQVRFSLGSLPGEVLRKVYFIAKRSGVLVDVESDTGGFALTLYGPEQAFGSADKYGRRLADVSLVLLRSLLEAAPGSDVSGTASLVLHDRPYRFHITAELLQRLEYAPDAQAGKGRVAEAKAAYSVGSAIEAGEDEPVQEPSFDSLVEAALYRSFKSLEKQGYTHGWLIQREPDPLVAGGGVVLIPDFAFVRGGRRVFMEVAGFWSPTYRERKVAKLRALVGRDGNGEAALVLAVPQEAGATFSGLPFPTVTYKKEVRATDLLSLLDAHFGEREARQEAAQSHYATLVRAATERGIVPESEVAQALEAYSRTELLSAVAGLEGDGCRYVPGVGLLADRSIEQVRAALRGAIAAHADGQIPLEDAAALAAVTLEVARVDIEALAQAIEGLSIERPSLFEAYLRLSE